MLTLIETNWPVFAAALLFGLLVAYLLWGRARAPRERHRAPDVLDEGAEAARRNQALIDAPSAASALHSAHATEAARVAAPLAGTGPGIMGGIGELLAAAATHEVAAAKDAEGDDLSRLKGVGPKLKARLAELGVTSFAQIAAWQDADIAAIDAQLGSFAGRATRDQWVAQASFLAAGDIAGYEAQFGKL
ncbi:MAG TPA: hypothetical protein VFF98_03240 [Novosphingobium sp.]|nr:hypothetical protein [Novosphingobium sp.]HZV10955.1 hypothetical protein [Novosphingobium sp.]